jgi:hypothetical protein
LDEETHGAELAAIIHTQPAALVKSRQVVLFTKKDATPTFVNYMSKHNEPLQYPLFFPTGAAGWWADNP